MVGLLGFEPRVLLVKSQMFLPLNYKPKGVWFAALRNALLDLRCDPALRKSANRTKQLRSRTIGLDFITDSIQIVKRKNVAEGMRIELIFLRSKRSVITRWQTPNKYNRILFSNDYESFAVPYGGLRMKRGDGIEPPDVSHCCKYPKNWSVVGESNSVNPGKSRVLRHQSLQPITGIAYG